MYYLTKAGLDFLNELKAPSIRGTLAGAAATAGPRIGGSTGTSDVGAKTGQSTRSQSPNWNPQQKKEIRRTMGRYKSRAVGDLEHKFTGGSWGRGGGKDKEPASLGPHQLSAWRKTATSGKRVPANRGETGAWGLKNTSNWQKWQNTNTNPKRFSVFRAAQGEKPDPRWPGVTSTDPFGSKTNREFALEVARRKGSGNDPSTGGTYRGPGDVIAPRSRPSPPDKIQALRDNPSDDPIIAQMKDQLNTSDRMAQVDKFDPEKQRQQQLDRVSDVMKQQKDTKANLNFSDLNPRLSATLRKKFRPIIKAGDTKRYNKKLTQKKPKPPK